MLGDLLRTQERTGIMRRSGLTLHTPGSGSPITSLSLVFAGVGDVSVSPMRTTPAPRLAAPMMIRDRKSRARWLNLLSTVWRLEC